MLVFDISGMQELVFLSLIQILGNVVFSTIKYFLVGSVAVKLRARTGMPGICVQTIPGRLLNKSSSAERYNGV